MGAAAANPTHFLGLICPPLGLHQHWSTPASLAPATCSYLRWQVVGVHSHAEQITCCSHRGQPLHSGGSCFATAKKRIVLLDHLFQWHNALIELGHKPIDLNGSYFQVSVDRKDSSPRKFKGFSRMFLSNGARQE